MSQGVSGKVQSAGGSLGAEQELRRLKEAIIDLYLAIKIRSTEEVSFITAATSSQTFYKDYNL